MAAANPLEAEITCSVCLDIYEDPHILIGCLHTYCLKCIKHLEGRRQIHCPDCRRVTKMKDIKKDFKTQKFIDIHKESQIQRNVVAKGKDKCGMCQNKSVPITHHCTDCEIFLCIGCSKGHQSNKKLKSHKLMSTSSLLKNIGSNLKETMGKLENQVKNVDAKLKSVSQRLTKAEKAMTQQIADVRKFTMDGIEDLKRNQKRLETLVTDANQKLFDHLHQSRIMFEQQKKDLLCKIALIKDLLKSQDIRTLKETFETVNEAIKQDISKIKEIIERKNVNLKSPVKVQKSKNLDVKSSIEVSIDNIQYDSQKIGSVLETLYSALLANTFTLAHATGLNFFPRSLSIIDNQLWCTGGNGCLKVFDLNCQHVKEIKCTQITDPQSVAKCGNEHVIVACFGNKGLHLLQSSGAYQSKILDGKFASVVSYNSVTFALEFETSKIAVLRNDANIWSEINSYQLQHSNGHCWDRLYVQGNSIYVSSINDNCIYIYDKYGAIQNKLGEFGCDRPGQLNGPILCDVDSDGNMLVIDRNNHRLQVCDSSGQWSVVKLPGEISCPSGVVVVGGGEMWITSTGIPYKLEKYTMSSSNHNITFSPRHLLVNYV